MTATPAASLIDTVTALWDDLGAEGCLCVEDLESGQSVSINEDKRMPLVSVAKLSIAAALFAEDSAGRIDARDTVLIDPATTTSGSTGISLFSDPVTISLRDLTVQMFSVSDNAAADAVYDRVGPAAIAALHNELGIRSLRVHSPMRALFGTLSEMRAADPSSVDSALLHSAHDQLFAKGSVLSLNDINSGTVRGIASMLRHIHHGEVVSPDVSAHLRQLMRTQVFRHRIASGFPMDTAEYYGKTGTLLTYRHDAGVVTDIDGRAYAVVVFTRSRIPAYSQPELDASIGYSARLCIEWLRDQRDQ
ncbi:serine hydrolase [Brevibacterium otitidis]|uniref:Serine hydrolase n=1 Tax=Brevibacterium otitidis TaxID=53364 RepID=A0ABV5X3W8_9MICO|nr:serine hydrolase [Brevibacterium otitidis]